MQFKVCNNHSTIDDMDETGGNHADEAHGISSSEETISAQCHTEGRFSLKEILQHYAAYTNQNLNDITYLLTLLKLYQPDPRYESLPSTGRTLLKISGEDFADSNLEGHDLFESSETGKKLPQGVTIDGGKYFHFGLENALQGSSPGVIHRDADLMQFAEVYLKKPHLLSSKLTQRVSIFFSFRTRIFNYTETRILSTCFGGQRAKNYRSFSQLLFYILKLYDVTLYYLNYL